MNLENLSQYLPQYSPKNTNKWIFAPIIILVLGIFIYILYPSPQKNAQNMAMLVPAHALMLFEHQNVKAFWESSRNLEAWKNLSQMPYFLRLDKNAHSLLDSLEGSAWRISQFLQNKRLMSSLHLSSNGELDYIFYVPFEGIEQDFLQKLLERFAQNQKIRLETREYQGQIIQEINDDQNNINFSCIFYKNYWIASFTPLLIEDVIRTTTGSTPANFYSLNKNIFDKKTTQDLSVYLNFQKIPEFLSLFVPDSLNESTDLAQIAQNWQAQAHLSDRQLRFEGDIFENENSFLPIFEGQLPTDATNLYEFVPKRTALLLRWGFSDSDLFREKLHEHLKKNSPDFEKIASQLKNDWRFDAHALFNQVYEEIAFAWVESSEGKTTEKLIWFKLKDASQVVASMKQLALNTQDSITFETYGDFKITKINVDNFPKALLGNFAAGFRSSYYTIINNYLILANTPQAIRSLADDLSKREVWGQLQAQSLFVNRTEKNSNVSLHINLLRSWTSLQSYLKPEWQEIFEQYKRQLLRFEFFNFQIQKNDENTKAILAIQHKQAKKLQGGSMEEIHRTKIEANIISKPYVVQNHLTKANEVFVQDENYQLHLISDQGHKRWKAFLDKSLISPIYQIDWLKNEKIQYLFATSQKIYLYDRLGRSVPNFPITRSWKSPIDKFSVLDFDKNRNYRLVAADQEGNLYMFSKAGTPIKEWNPRKLLGRLSHSVGHIRTNNEDYILAVQQNGLITAIRPDGQTFRAFPISLDVNLFSPYFLRYNDQAENSTVTVLSRAGEIIRLNLKGQILQRHELGFTEKTTGFFMATDEAENDNWVAVRQDQDGSVAVYGADGKLWFEKNFSDQSPKIVQYFNFGANAEVIALTDRKNRKTFLFYPDGESVYQGYIDNDHAVSLLYQESQEEFLLYTCFGTQMRLLRIVKN